MADEILQPIEINLDEAPKPAPEIKAPAETSPAAVSPPVPTKSPDGIETLRARLAEVEGREKSEREGRAAAEQHARQRDAELARVRSEQAETQAEIGDTRYQVVLNSIDAFKRESELAQRDYATALATGNFEASADAQKRMARTEAQLVQLEAGKTAMEEQARAYQQQVRQQAAQPAPQRQATPADRFEQYVGQFTQRSQSYLRAHPEYVMDQKLNNRLTRMHGEAVDDLGLIPDTEAYFNFLDERMGSQNPPATTRSQQPAAAPVSRQPTGGGGYSGSVTLSPAEREAARISGVTEIEYARQMLALQASGDITRH